MRNQLLILLVLLSYVLPKLLESKNHQYLDLQVGAALNQNIPLLFHNFQHTHLQNFTSSQHNLSTPICRVQLDKPPLLNIVKQIPYTPFGQNQTQIRDHIIYNITELRNLKLFVDAVYFNQKLIALFENNELLIYNIDLTTGILSIDMSVNLTYFPNLNDAQLTIFNQHCYIISHESIIYIDTYGQAITIADYSYAQFTLGDASQIGYLFCVPQEEQGLFIYVYDAKAASLKLVRNATFEINDGTVQVDFSVDEFFFDHHTRQMFILDHEQGLLQTKLSQLYNSSHVIVKDSKLLRGGCQNLVVNQYYIYITCPQILMLKRQTLKVENVIHNSFAPYTVHATPERIYFFGRQEFAVFDILGSLVEEHTLGVHAEKSIVVGNYIITFTNAKVISHSIVSHSDTLYCNTNDIAFKGYYEGLYRSYGICSEYINSVVNLTEICFIQYPFSLTIKDSAPPNYTVEIVMIVLWSVVLLGAVLYCAIKNFLIHRGYKVLQNTLVEEQSQAQSHQSKPKLDEDTTENIKQPPPHKKQDQEIAEDEEV